MSAASVVPGQLADYTSATDIREGWFSRAVHSACFIALICWPYALVDRQLSVLALMSISVVALLNQPLRMPQLSALLMAFVGYVLLVLGLQLFGTGFGPYTLSQSNHLIQFAIYYFAFSKIVQGCDWTAILTSRRFLLGAAALSALYYWSYGRLQAGANESDLNITLLALLLGLFIRGWQGGRLFHFVLMSVVSLVVIVTSDRSSVLLMLGVILFLYWIPMPRLTMGLVVAVVLLLPVAYYLLIDNQTVLWLYKLDHNTGIRAEFVRGAASLLNQSPVFGIGFGGPYRPVNFPYLTNHPYLRDFGTVHIVSNHHSLFDVALRLGLPVAAIFAFGIFRRRTQDEDRNPAYQVLAIAAAIGLSFNAAFENQGQLPQLVLIIAMLQAGSGSFARLPAGAAKTSGVPQ